MTERSPTERLVGMITGFWASQMVYAASKLGIADQRDRRGSGRKSVTADRWRALALVGRWTFAALFVAGGVGHFVATDVYMRIMPPYLPWHRPLVLMSGALEIALGILLLVPVTARLAAWGLIALLVAVFPANLFMYEHPEKFDLPQTLLLLRLPLQGVLVLWAYTYTRR